MRFLFLAAAGFALCAPALAQDGRIEGRVGKLEAEMRAVQRKVFPGGAGRLVEPEVQPQAAPEAATGVPATSAVADLTARVATLERQLQTVTGDVEQNQFKLRQLDEAFQAYRRATDARLKAMEARPAASPAPAALADGAEEPADTGAAPRPAAAPGTAAASGTVARPDTGDAAEDAYMYGYRLWEAKQYAAAERQLKEVVAKYPKHRRASYAQNLLGRAYLDEGKPSLASIAFYDNYKKMPDGERAPHSLYYLAQALQTLKKPADACKVYGELTDVYGSRIDARMKADIAKGRAAAKCGG